MVIFYSFIGHYLKYIGYIFHLIPWPSFDGFCKPINAIIKANLVWKLFNK